MKVKLTNPALDESGEDSYRVNRGGYWYDSPSYVRASLRDDFTPTSRGNAIGFRLAKTK